MESLVAHVHTRPVPPSERTELPISAALDALVLACLEKSPADRPQNVEELLKRLDACEAGNDWTGVMAQRWWKTHLPELAGPLPSIDEPPPSVAGAETV
jgi:eukaryotic-like serine/threonine-protein kinase